MSFALVAILKSCEVPDEVLQIMKKDNAIQELRQSVQSLVGKCTLLQCPTMQRLKAENEALSRQNETLKDQILDQEIDEELNKD